VITFEFLKIFHWILAKSRLYDFFKVEFSVKISFLSFIDNIHMNDLHRDINADF